MAWVQRKTREKAAFEDVNPDYSLQGTRRTQSD